MKVRFRYAMPSRTLYSTTTYLNSILDLFGVFFLPLFDCFKNLFISEATPVFFRVVSTSSSSKFITVDSETKMYHFEKVFTYYIKRNLPLTNGDACVHCNSGTFIPYFSSSLYFFNSLGS